MEKVIIGNATLYRGDCMEAMAEMPDNAFDLAIVDPPYEIDAEYFAAACERIQRAQQQLKLAL